MLPLYLFEVETEVVLRINIRFFQNTEAFYIKLAYKDSINKPSDREIYDINQRFKFLIALIKINIIKVEF